MKKISVLCAVVVLLVPVLVSAAAPPALINYQGRLIDGATLVNGTTQMVFRIYDDPTAGSLLFADTQTVTVADGLYAVQIGASNAMSATTFRDNATTYLELTVGATTFSPRERIFSVGYALNADYADQVGSVGSDSG